MFKYKKVNLIFYKILFLAGLAFHQNLCNSNIIIFDIFGVLFDVSTHDQKLFNFTEINSLYIDILSKIAIPNYKMDNNIKQYIQKKSKYFAPIYYAHQTGKITSQSATKIIFNHIENLDKQNFFSNQEQKKLIEQAVKLDFDIETRKKFFVPLAKGIELLKRCSNQKHKLYVLSNVETEMINHLIKTYPEIFSQFDGTITSADAGYIKPDPRIYEVLLKKFNLDPKECTLIDDQQANIEMANHLHINGIVCQDFDTVTKELENKKLLTSSTK